jgi:hypothetical protein
MVRTPPATRVAVAFDPKGMKMSAKLINGGHQGATLTATPAMSSARPRLDVPPIVQFPKRFPFSAPANGQFNPGARWLEFHLNGPWFKKPKKSLNPGNL